MRRLVTSGPVLFIKVSVLVCRDEKVRQKKKNKRPICSINEWISFGFNYVGGKSRSGGKLKNK